MLWSMKDLREIHMENWSDLGKCQVKIRLFPHIIAKLKKKTFGKIMLRHWYAVIDAADQTEYLI